MVSTISLLGCSTSVALTMGPTEEERRTYASHPLLPYVFAITDLVHRQVHLTLWPFTVQHTIYVKCEYLMK